MSTFDRVWNFLVATVTIILSCFGMFVWWPNYQNTITECNKSLIDYESTTKNNASLYSYEGYTEDGSYGELEKCYTRSGNLATETVVKNPVDEVEVVGTKVDVAPISLFSRFDQEEEEEYLCEGYPTVCDDGSCSYSTGRGTCSWHGGVWYYN